jgi:hypothetical protein
MLLLQLLRNGFTKGRRFKVDRGGPTCQADDREINGCSEPSGRFAAPNAFAVNGQAQSSLSAVGQPCEEVDERTQGYRSIRRSQSAEVEMVFAAGHITLVLESVSFLFRISYYAPIIALLGRIF